MELASLAQLERSHRRHDEVMAGLLEAARRLAAGRPDDGDILHVKEAVAYFERAVTRHFLDEEGSVFPRLSTRRPDLAGELASLSAEHPTQIAAQGEVAAAARELDDEARPSVGKALLDAANRLADLHRAHVTREDEIFRLAHDALTGQDDVEIITEMETRRDRDDETGGGGGRRARGSGGGGGRGMGGGGGGQGRGTGGGGMGGDGRGGQGRGMGGGGGSGQGRSGQGRSMGGGGGGGGGQGRGMGGGGGGGGQGRGMGGGDGGGGGGGQGRGVEAPPASARAVTVPALPLAQARQAKNGAPPATSTRTHGTPSPKAARTAKPAVPTKGAKPAPSAKIAHPAAAKAGKHPTSKLGAKPGKNASEKNARAKQGKPMRLVTETKKPAKKSAARARR